jgi:hypothetical protein
VPSRQQNPQLPGPDTGQDVVVVVVLVVVVVHGTHDWTPFVLWLHVSSGVSGSAGAAHTHADACHASPSHTYSARPFG